eukprot:4785-Pleurochrysis_carterae.AAC.1
MAYSPRGWVRRDPPPGRRLLVRSPARASLLPVARRLDDGAGSTELHECRSSLAYYSKTCTLLLHHQLRELRANTSARHLAALKLLKLVELDAGAH